MEIIDKIVDFTWCRKCKHEKDSEATDICNECLNNPANVNSQRPINYKPKEK